MFLGAPTIGFIAKGGSSGGGGGGITGANNGLSVSGGTTVQLGGGSLIHDTHIPLNGFNLDATYNGDIMFLLDPSSNKCFIGNAATSTAAGYWDSAVSQSTIGDVFNQGNQTQLFLDDLNQFLTYQRGSNLYLSLDVSNYLFQLGDISGSISGFLLKIDANNIIATIGTDHPYFSIDVASHIFQMGDIDGNSGGTLVKIEDLLQLVTIGDANLIGNQTNLILNDASQLLTYQKGSDIYFSLNVNSKAFGIGDISLSGNNTNIIINDASPNITINSKEIVALGDVYNGNNNTFLNLSDATQLLTYQKGGSYRFLTLDIFDQAYVFGDSSFPAYGNGNYIALTNSGGPPNTSVNIQARDFLTIGDGDAVGNNTFLENDNNAQILTYQKGSDVYFSTDIANLTGFWGNPGGNNTNVSWNDAAGTVDFIAINGLTLNGNPLTGANIFNSNGALTANREIGLNGKIFDINNDAMGSFPWFEISPNDPNITLGTFPFDNTDYSRIFIETGVMTLESNIGSGGLNSSIEISGNNEKVTITGGITNGTKGVWDDAGRIIKLMGGTKEYLYIETTDVGYIMMGDPTVWTANLRLDTSGVSELGDINALGNNTYLSIDDAAQTINIQNTGITTIGSSGAGNGTRTIWNDGMQKISFGNNSSAEYVLFDFNNGQYFINRATGNPRLLIDAQNLIASLGDIDNTNNGTKGIFDDTAQTISLTAANGIIFNNQARLKNYTVATLPAGTQGEIAYVTDALLPGFLTIIAGGGAVKTPVFYNGTNWVAF